MEATLWSLKVMSGKDFARFAHLHSQRYHWFRVLWCRDLHLCLLQHNAKLVWDETVHITDDLFHNLWQDRTEVAYDNALDLTLPVSHYLCVDSDYWPAVCDQLALYVIGAAGFGYRMTWKDAAKVPNGHKMSFQVYPIISTLCLFMYWKFVRKHLRLCRMTSLSKCSYRIGWCYSQRELGGFDRPFGS